MAPLLTLQNFNFITSYNHVPSQKEIGSMTKFRNLSFSDLQSDAYLRMAKEVLLKEEMPSWKKSTYPDTRFPSLCIRLIVEWHDVDLQTLCVEMLLFISIANHRYVRYNQGYAYTKLDHTIEQDYSFADNAMNFNSDLWIQIGTLINVPDFSSCFDICLQHVIKVEADLIKQNTGKRQYSTKSMVLIKSAKGYRQISTCDISNSDSKFDALDHSAI
ncbi:hypothetical protein J6590_008162 [Homalodisca vitripennis]|nr:hypothetical protein J6590_008162 [Homalodisca vitripennis]